MLFSNSSPHGRCENLCFVPFTVHTGIPHFDQPFQFFCLSIFLSERHSIIDFFTVKKCSGSLKQFIGTFFSSHFFLTFYYYFLYKKFRPVISGFFFCWLFALLLHVAIMQLTMLHIVLKQADLIIDKNSKQTLLQLGLIMEFSLEVTDEACRMKNVNDLKKTLGEIEKKCCSISTDGY